MMNTQFKEQQCNVVGLALSWIGYAAGLGYFGYQHQWVVALLWMVGLPILRWAMYQFFPLLSRFLGYGRIVDKFAPVTVNFSTFFSCPFCPIVLARLQALQEQIGFVLKTFDVTLKPQTLMTKGIRSVPVVEVADRRLVGNSTTEQLVGLITLGQVPEINKVLAE